VSIVDVYAFLQLTEMSSAFLDAVFTVPGKIQNDHKAFQEEAKKRHQDARAKRYSKKLSSEEREREKREKQKREKNQEDQFDKQRRLSLTLIPVITFAQFAMAIWLLTHYEIATLAFSIFDADGSGSLDMDEVRGIVKKVYSNDAHNEKDAEPIQAHSSRPATPNSRAMQLLEGMDVDGSGDVSQVEFCLMAKS